MRWWWNGIGIGHNVIYDGIGISSRLAQHCMQRCDTTLNTYIFIAHKLPFHPHQVCAFAYILTWWHIYHALLHWKVQWLFHVVIWKAHNSWWVPHRRTGMQNPPAIMSLSYHYTKQSSHLLIIFRQTFALWKSAKRWLARARNSGPGHLLEQISWDIENINSPVMFGCSQAQLQAKNHQDEPYFCPLNADPWPERGFDCDHMTDFFIGHYHIQ